MKENVKWSLYFKKLLLIVIGTMIEAFGIDLAIHAGFGGASLSVLWMGTSKVFGITLGQASWIIAGIMVVFCFFYDRRQINVGTIVFQAIYGLFVDAFENVVGTFYSQNIYINFILMILGIIICAAGVALYAYADFGRGAYEAVTFAFSEKNHWQVRIVRSTQDLLCVVLGVLMGGKFGICTIATILISGYFIQLFGKACRKLIKIEKATVV